MARIKKVNRVKTGNRPHRASSPEQRAAAKRYGEYMGYSGAGGGWIYDRDNNHIVHGWGQFYWMFSGAVNKFSKVLKESEIVGREATDDQVRKLREWAESNGFSSKSGWIYAPINYGKPICRGWRTLYGISKSGKLTDIANGRF